MTDTENNVWMACWNKLEGTWEHLCGAWRKTHYNFFILCSYDEKKSFRDSIKYWHWLTLPNKKTLKILNFKPLVSCNVHVTSLWQTNAELCTLYRLAAIRRKWLKCKLVPTEICALDLCIFKLLYPFPTRATVIYLCLSSQSPFQSPQRGLMSGAMSGPRIRTSKTLGCRSWACKLNHSATGPAPPLVIFTSNNWSQHSCSFISCMTREPSRDQKFLISHPFILSFQKPRLWVRAILTNPTSLMPTPKGILGPNSSMYVWRLPHINKMWSDTSMASKNSDTIYPEIESDSTAWNGMVP